MRRGSTHRLEGFGDADDNALAETINGLYKTEVIYKAGPWRGLEAVEQATLTWVDWFNHRRLLQPIGDVPPAEYEMMYYQLGRVNTNGHSYGILQGWN